MMLLTSIHAATLSVTLATLAATNSAALAAAATQRPTQPQIELRGQQQPPPGRIVGVQPSGILLAPLDVGEAQTTSGIPTLIIGWDRVRRIHGDFAPHADPYTTIAETAWRARTRLERGDAFAAEPLFERLFEHYRPGQDQTVDGGATAAVIAEGLLRCRLRRGAHIAAIEPWLALLGNSSDLPAVGADWAQQADLPPVLDPATSLAPALPPMWLRWPAVEALARAGHLTHEEPSLQITGRAEALAALYLHAARVETGIPAPPPQVRSSDPGVQLVLNIVQSRSGNAEQRQRARQRLEDRMKPVPTAANVPPSPLWIEVWCRAAIGRSLVREQSEELRKLGILELLHLPARFAAAHPYLSGLALAEAAEALRDLGDQRSADILMRQLAEKYPTHPVHDWDRLRSSRLNLPRPQIQPPDDRIEDDQPEKPDDPSRLPERR